MDWSDVLWFATDLFHHWLKIQKPIFYVYPIFLFITHLWLRQLLMLIYQWCILLWINDGNSWSFWMNSLSVFDFHFSILLNDIFLYLFFFWSIKKLTSIFIGFFFNLLLFLNFFFCFDDTFILVLILILHLLCFLLLFNLLFLCFYWIRKRNAIDITAVKQLKFLQMSLRVSSPNDFSACINCEFLPSKSNLPSFVILIRVQRFLCNL